MPLLTRRKGEVSVSVSGHDSRAARMTPSATLSRAGTT